VAQRSQLDPAELTTPEWQSRRGLTAVEVLGLVATHGAFAPVALLLLRSVKRGSFHGGR
jgi:hypothetical protein